MNDVVTGIVASGVFAGIVSIVTCIFMIVFRKPFARDAGASRNLVIVRSPPCTGRRGRLPVVGAEDGRLRGWTRGPKTSKSNGVSRRQDPVAGYPRST